MRKLNRIVVHCSDSAFGDAALINEWHKSRWKASPSGKFIGYHYVVLNGRRTSVNLYDRDDDGSVEEGRPVDEIGCHAAGANTDSIGVCLVGKGGLYTVAQILAASVLIEGLCANHKIPISSVFGHYQIPNAGKSCPDIEIDHLRSLVKGDR